MFTLLHQNALAFSRGSLVRPLELIKKKRGPVLHSGGDWLVVWLWMKCFNVDFCFCVSFPNFTPTRHSVMDLKGISLDISRLETT